MHHLQIIMKHNNKVVKVVFSCIVWCWGEEVLNCQLLLSAFFLSGTDSTSSVKETRGEIWSH